MNSIISFLTFFSVIPRLKRLIKKRVSCEPQKEIYDKQPVVSRRTDKNFPEK
jgi:hypothetical protein